MVSDPQWVTLRPECSRCSNRKSLVSPQKMDSHERFYKHSWDLKQKQKTKKCMDGDLTNNIGTFTSEKTFRDPIQSWDLDIPPSRRVYPWFLFLSCLRFSTTVFYYLYTLSLSWLFKDVQLSLRVKNRKEHKQGIWKIISL